MTPTFRNSDDAFEEAIRIGRLSSISTDAHYAGHYMYMGTWAGVDAFKHTTTRRSLVDTILPPEQGANE